MRRRCVWGIIYRMEPCTCYEALINCADKKTNIIFYGHKISVEDFIRDVEGLAASFREMGLKRGDTVTVYLPSCPQGVAAFYACSKLGLVANMVHPLVPVDLLKQNLRRVNSKALMFFDVLLRDENVLDDCGILIRCSVADYVTLRKPVYALFGMAGKRRRDVRRYRSLVKNPVIAEIEGGHDDAVCYMHSGGTGGDPKVVALSNDSFNNTAQAMKLMYHPSEEVRAYNLATLPIFHAYGLCAAVHTALVLGYGVILVPKYDVKTVCRVMKKHRVTCWMVVPAMLKKMMVQNRLDTSALKNLDVIWCGGDVLDESLVEEVDEVLRRRTKRARLMRGYGLTEVCGVCAVNSFDFYKKGSCGKPMPTCEIRIFNDDGYEVPCGERGEIAVCAGGNMIGYLDGGGVTEKYGKKWILTGDVGYVDEEGFLFVVDRKKRSLKIAAVNVFPAQVENCIKTLPFVDEACVVGYLFEGKQYLKAFVTLKASTPRQKVKEQVTAVCRDNLIPYSVPRFVEVLDKMPRTPLGKIDYRSLENK